MDIVNHPVFQRLRRIRQLAFSEHVYPGAVHTRFEHSLGVMHIAQRLFDAIEKKHREFLIGQMGFTEDHLSRARQLVRLAALLHDVGHAPFSHAGEELMPLKDPTAGVTGDRLDHEDYSCELIRHEMEDVIDDHPENKDGLHIRANEVADFYMGGSGIGRRLLFWKELVSGQLDADRMDYLLRDSLHCGVSYGHFDLDRIVDTITIIENKGGDTPNEIGIAIEQGGRHAAEGMILARYFMFNQVYFHKSRIAYDHHAQECLSSRVKGTLPDPRKAAGRKQFLDMDDWALSSHIKSGKCGRHGDAILNHAHDRCVHETHEVAKPNERKEHDQLMEELRNAQLDVWEADTERSWYKVGRSEIQIAENNRTGQGLPESVPLAEESEIVSRIRDVQQSRIFVPKDQAEEAKEIIEKVRKKV